jgi:hypothetical protein
MGRGVATLLYAGITAVLFRALLPNLGTHMFPGIWLIGVLCLAVLAAYGAAVLLGRDIRRPRLAVAALSLLTSGRMVCRPDLRGPAAHAGRSDFRGRCRTRSADRR